MGEPLQVAVDRRNGDDRVRGPYLAPKVPLLPLEATLLDRFRTDDGRIVRRPALPNDRLHGPNVVGRRESKVGITG
jgi:hypothetical protein